MDATLAGLEFAQLVKRSDQLASQPALDRACLLISAAFDKRADVDRCEAQLDEIAESARRILGCSTESYAIAGAVCRALFDECGFTGNSSHYDDPRNSLLSDVLDRRVGIPITLSIVVMEVSRRLGLPLDGVGLPGHFVVRFPDPTSRLYIDAFAGGRILDTADCVRLVERQSGGRITWTDDFLDPVTPTAILKRVLVNLKNSLSQAKDYGAALTAIELQLALDPEDPTELRDRGILFARLHRYDRAIADLEAYLERSPDAADVKQIRDTVLRYLREARNL
jgi:regulator of sirC expression with transglutaminase-like and TPR domain